MAGAVLWDRRYCAWRIVPAASGVRCSAVSMVRRLSAANSATICSEERADRTDPFDQTITDPLGAALGPMCALLGDNPAQLGLQRADLDIRRRRHSRDLPHEVLVQPRPVVRLCLDPGASDLPQFGDTAGHQQ